jgi:hypothetical protein
MKVSFEEQKLLREEQKLLIEKAKEMNVQLAPVREELKALKSKRDSVSNFCGNYSNLYKLEAELKSAKERLVFGNIGQAEEKRLIADKKRLEELKPYIMSFANLESIQN